MHFPIITLSTTKKPKKDWVKDLPYDNATLSYFTDYYGELYPPAARKELLKADWFKELFSCLATIDAVKGEIKVFDKEQIAATLKAYYQNLVEEFTEKQYDPIGFSVFYNIRERGYNYKHCDALFMVDGYSVLTSMQFIEDLLYYSAKGTLYVENIFDAHV